MAAIERPTQLAPERVTDNWTVLPSYLPVPGMGVLAVNSFLLKGREPLLVDTGLAALREEFLDCLAAEIDLEDLRWIWVSHMDADHVGNLAAVLARAPAARVVTNFLGLGKMNLAGLDTGRVHLLQPGERLAVGGHDLVPVRPPYYDAPETVGFFDATDRVLFAADSFGALLPEPAEEIGEISDATLRDGLVGWSSIDAPWLANADQVALGRTLAAIERLDPGLVLSGHLPLARNGVAALTRHVAAAYCNGTEAMADPLSFDHLLATLN